MVFPCCDSPDSHATCGAWLAVISPHVPDSQHSGLRILSAANAQVKVQRRTVLQRDRPGCSLDCLLIEAIQGLSGGDCERVLAHAAWAVKENCVGQATVRDSFPQRAGCAFVADKVGKPHK